MSVPRDYHATIFVDPDVAAPIEAVRRTWDPKMAAAIPAHVTLVYPQEITTPQVLVARVADVSFSFSPFELEISDVACFGDPKGGVYLRVLDTDQAFERLRERLLRPPFQPASFDPHITLVHPRTSDQGPKIWATREDVKLSARFMATSIAITAYDSGWQTLHEFELVGRAV